MPVGPSDENLVFLILFPLKLCFPVVCLSKGVKVASVRFSPVVFQ